MTLFCSIWLITLTTYVLSCVHEPLTITIIKKHSFQIFYENKSSEFIGKLGEMCFDTTTCIVILQNHYSTTLSADGVSLLILQR